MDYVMDSTFDQDKKCWVVSISGEVDIFNAANMKKTLTELINEKNTDLILDCKNLEYIDSTALGALVGVLKNVRSYGGTMHLRSVKPSLSKLFKITNLDKVFVMDGDSDE
jgi:anti-sigma B factor antagonist